MPSPRDPTRPQRVALLSGARGIPFCAPGGAAVHLRGMATAFVACGADLEVWTRRVDPGGQGPAVPATVPVLLAPRGRLPGSLRRHIPTWDRVVDGAAMERWVLDQARRFRPTLLYERCSLFAAAGREASRRLGIRWVLELNAPLAWEACWYEGFAPHPTLLRREGETLRAADAVHVVSAALRDYALRRGVAAERIQVVPNGATERGRADSDRPPRAADAPFVLGYAGTFKPWQGLPTALPSLAELAAALLPRTLHLHLHGDGPDHRAFLDALRRRLPSLVVRDHGWTEHALLTDARRRWDAAWVPRGPWPPPSTKEGLPTAVLEQRLGEAAPSWYFDPLKAAEARLASLPIWRGDGLPRMEASEASRSWEHIAADLLGTPRPLPSPAPAPPIRGKMDPRQP